MRSLPGAASYADLCKLPPHLIGEIVRGQMITHPRPAPKHATAYSALGGELWNPFHRGRNGPGGWWILDEPELHLDEDILVPDMAGWRRSRMPSLPETAWFELAPDWVCEILSPSTARSDRVGKLPIYARQGVSHAWLVDPELRTLEVFENMSGKWLLLAVLENDNAVSQAPFDAITFDLSDLWAD
ncbi:MAG TPA: Uma2 family endonuclease [Rhodocyclaceae bacterium]|nr:Uma2 family endonuclease [Rhodocyclaceae bacterium]